MHSEELHGSYSSPNIIRMIKSGNMRWAEHVARMWGDENIEHRRRWEDDNIKM
jgi:hypothetical protein